MNGNRTISGYSTGTANRLTSDGTYNYTYDDNGNVLTKTRISDSQRWEFSWDYRNRLTQVIEKNSGGTVVKQANYMYDVFDRRIGSTVDSDGAGSGVPTTRWTMYDGPGLGAKPYVDWIDPDGSGPTLDSRRLSADLVDTVLARWKADGSVAWYLTDKLGSVRDVANNSGTVLDHINYDSYGQIHSESNPSNGDRFKFTGYEYDSETGLFQARARFYDPGTGRFVSDDPIGFNGGDSNLYRYVGNAPNIGTDSLGLYEGDRPWYEGRMNPWAWPGARVIPNWIGGYKPAEPDIPIRPQIDQHSLPTGPGTYRAGSLGTYWGCGYSEAGRCAGAQTQEMTNRATAAAMEGLATSGALRVNPHLAGRTPVPGTRGTGVARATKAEVDLVKRTGKGTISWRNAEVEYIKRTGKLPDGIVGHHINSVAEFPEWAGDPRNIRFVRGQVENLAEHGGYFRNGTTGPLIER